MLLQNIHDFGLGPKSLAVTAAQYGTGAAAGYAARQITQVVLERAGACQVGFLGPEDPAADVCSVATTVAALAGGLFGNSAGRGAALDTIAFAFPTPHGTKAITLSVPFCPGPVYTGTQSSS